MSIGRGLATTTAALAVAGCAALVVGLAGHGAPDARADRDPGASTAPTARPAYLPVDAAAGAAVPVDATTGTATTAAAPSTAAASTRAPIPPVTTRGAATSTPASAAPPASSRPAAGTRAAAPANHPAPVQPAGRPPAPVHHAAPARPTSGSSLPLRMPTGSATRVLTVVAHSTGSTVATLQAWQKSGSRWVRVGSPTTAHLGSDGLSAHASESRSATPIGSFTLTQAFGRQPDPGTALPYFHTTPADYWISDAGSQYNTHQRCPGSNSGCHDDGTNERLYYETPYYDYAVVIDYNTRNAPGGVRAGAGSAFFLHVTDGAPTAGCVAISRTRLVSIMRWLAPSTHPRILIGVG